MLSPLLTGPQDPDFLHALNRRLADLATGIESVSSQIKSSAAAARAADTADFGALISDAAGSHAQRLAYNIGQLNVGATWWETDRQVLYVVHRPSAEVNQWKYLAGQMRGTLSPSTKPTDLNNAGDIGFRFYSTDFAHTYRWNGTAWRFAIEDGDPGSGVIEWWVSFPNNNGVYQICDGTTATRSLNAGGTGSITTPNLIGAYPKGNSAYTGTVVAATAPTVTVNASSGTTGVTAGATSVASTGHTHTATATAGEPAHVDLIPYMRL